MIGTMTIPSSRIVVFALACAASSFALTASPNDKPQGWASQGGGTTGGAGGWVDTATTISELQTLAKKTGKGIIYIKGTMGNAGSKTTKGGDRIVPTADKTFLGLPGATIKGGFDIKVSNIVIRNLAVWGPGAYDIDGNDPIHIEGTGAKNIWIDHCLVSDGQDGNLDITNGANYVTVSWTKFSYTSLSSNHQYCNLIGSSASKTSDKGFLKTTMINNYWADGVVERMPRVRFGEVHVVNNLIKTNTSNYAVRAGQEANILVEKNLFVGTKNPINIFTDESGQMVKVTSDNVFKNTSGTKAGINDSKVFTPPYTLTGLLDAAGLEVTVGDAANGAGPTIDSWSTSALRSEPGVPSGARLDRMGSTWTLSNASSAPMTLEIRSLDGRRLGNTVTLAAGQTFALAAERSARFVNIKSASGAQVVTVPGL